MLESMESRWGAAYRHFVGKDRGECPQFWRENDEHVNVHYPLYSPQNSEKKSTVIVKIFL